MMSVALEGGLAYLALAMSVLFLGVAAWRSLMRGRIYAFLFGALSLYGFFALIYLPDLERQFSGESARLAAYVFFTGTLLLLVSMTLCERALPRATYDGRARWRHHFDAGANAHIHWSMIAGGVSLTLFLVSRQDLFLTWSEARAEGEGIAVVAATFLLLISFPAIATSFLKGRYLSAAVLLALNLACFVMSGSRAAALAALVAFFWLVFMRARSGAMRIGIVTGVAFLGFLAHVTLRFIRGLSPSDLVAVLQSGSLLDLWRSSVVSEDASGGESDVATYLVYAVGPSQSGAYGFMTSIVRLTMLFFPKEWTPFDKPLDVTYQLWASAFSDGLFSDAQGMGLLEESFISGNFGSVHATLFGELFVSGGWLALMLSVVLVGIFCVLIDRCLQSLKGTQALLLLGPTAVGMVMIGRGNSVIGFGYFAYIATFVVVLGMLGRLILSGWWIAPRSQALEP